MKTFDQWLLENHPESLDENWRDTMRAGARVGTTAAGVFLGGFFPPHNTALGDESDRLARSTVARPVSVQRDTVSDAGSVPERVRPDPYTFDPSYGPQPPITKNPTPEQVWKYQRKLCREYERLEFLKSRGVRGVRFPEGLIDQYEMLSQRYGKHKPLPHPAMN